MPREVFSREEGTARGERFRYVRGDISLVKRARTFCRNDLKRCGKDRETDHIALIGRCAIKQIMLGRAGVCLELADVFLPVKRNTGRHRKSAFGIFDRLRQCAVEAKASMRFQDYFPGIDSTWDGHGMNRVADLAHSFVAQRLVGRLCAGATRTVVSPHRFAGLRDQAVTIAADPGHVRLDHTQHRDRGHRCIRRRAACTQRINCSKRRERV